MKITTYSARADGDTPKDEMNAWLDIQSIAGGYGAMACFYPKWHCIVLVREKNNPSRCALVALPSNRWLDSIEDQWEVISHVVPFPALDQEVEKE